MGEEVKIGKNLFGEIVVGSEDAKKILTNIISNNLVDFEIIMNNSEVYNSSEITGFRINETEPGDEEE